MIEMIRWRRSFVVATLLVSLVRDFTQQSSTLFINERNERHEQFSPTILFEDFEDLEEEFLLQFLKILEEEFQGFETFLRRKELKDFKLS